MCLPGSRFARIIQYAGTQFSKVVVQTYTRTSSGDHYHRSPPRSSAFISSQHLVLQKHTLLTVYMPVLQMANEIWTHSDILYEIKKKLQLNVCPTELPSPPLTCFPL